MGIVFAIPNKDHSGVHFSIILGDKSLPSIKLGKQNYISNYNIDINYIFLTFV